MVIMIVAMVTYPHRAMNPEPPASEAPPHTITLLRPSNITK